MRRVFSWWLVRADIGVTRERAYLDLLPASRTNLNLVKSANDGECGHEEAIQRRADRYHFKRG